MRIVSCVLLLACCCFTLTGCGLFRTQSGGGDSKRPPLFGGSQAQSQPKKPAEESPQSDDPLLKSNHNSDQFTTLAGRVVDVGNAPLSYAYIRKTCLDDAAGKEAPIDVAVNQEGYFAIYDAKPGKRYKLEARAKQNGKLVATSVQVAAPQSHLHLILKAENVLPDTPPLPPPPGIPAKPKNLFNETDGGKSAKTNSQGSATPKQSGLSIGPPMPMGNKGSQDWEAAPDGSSAPKYPDNIAQGPSGLNTSPKLEIAGDGKAPKFGDAGSGKQKSGAYVPSCVVVGKRLLNFALPDYYGTPWEWKADRLGKVVLLDFWRTNCPPCLASIDQLRVLRNKYGPEGLEVLGIAAENNGTPEQQRANVARICQLKQTNYRILMATGPSNPMLTNFSIQALPTLILLDDQGNILWRHDGGLDEAGWKALDLHIQMKLAQ